MKDFRYRQPEDIVDDNELKDFVEEILEGPPAQGLILLHRFKSVLTERHFNGHQHHYKSLFDFTLNRIDSNTVYSLYLDDCRPCPPGMIHCYWPNEAVMFMEHFTVGCISLDHDLGDDEKGTGYDVLTYLEERAFHRPESLSELTHIAVHSANPPARCKMEQAITSIKRLQQSGRC